MESEKAKIGCPQTCGERKKRPDLCPFIDKDPIEIKKRLLEMPSSARSTARSNSVSFSSGYVARTKSGCEAMKFIAVSRRTLRGSKPPDRRFRTRPNKKLKT